MRVRGSSKFQKRSTSDEDDSELRRGLAAFKEAEAFCDSLCLGVRVAGFFKARDNTDTLLRALVLVNPRNPHITPVPLGAAALPKQNLNHRP